MHIQPLLYLNRIIQYGSRRQFATVASNTCTNMDSTYLNRTFQWTILSIAWLICTLVILITLLSALFCRPYGNYLHASRTEWDAIHTNTQRQADACCCIDWGDEEFSHIKFRGIWQRQLFKYNVSFYSFLLRFTGCGAVRFLWEFTQLSKAYFATACVSAEIVRRSICF
jgi:hypothetical protein